ncbi:hypothetical protein DH2020_039800 [Rehmannia glutinosa]|uniref:CASP-like protein n=1 Tax=Rehmannia glutinosa TaxID=99300 RepID=A0ABR0UVZ4_REHGL
MKAICHKSPREKETPLKWRKLKRPRLKYQNRAEKGKEKHRFSRRLLPMIGRRPVQKGVAIFDLILRISAATAALAATITMGTTEQTLPFFTQFFQFQASYDDLPTFTTFSFTAADGYFGYLCCGASAAIVYLAHNGNSDANWLAICQQFNDFCQRTSGAVVAAFVAAVLLIFLVVLSAVALKRR